MQITQDSFSGDHDLMDMEILARERHAENLHVTDLPYPFSSWALEHHNNIHVKSGLEE